MSEIVMVDDEWREASPSLLGVQECSRNAVRENGFQGMKTKE